MSITGYKEKFADLFGQMCDEHGMASCVHIELTDAPLYKADGIPHAVSVAIQF